jgi:hypothetical protein
VKLLSNLVFILIVAFAIAWVLVHSNLARKAEIKKGRETYLNIDFKLTYDRGDFNFCIRDFILMVKIGMFLQKLADNGFFSYLFLFAFFCSSFCNSFYASYFWKYEANKRKAIPE